MRRAWIKFDTELSIRRQCRLAQVSRSFFYYKPAEASDVDRDLKQLIEGQFLKHPEFGYRRMIDFLREKGFAANHKHVLRLMQELGIQAVTPGPHTSKPSPENRVYPYLLRCVDVERVNQVWSTDITYIPMKKGFMYLTAVIDWRSRYIMSWELSNSMDSEFCIDALKRALECGTPEIFNTDQGAQFTAKSFTQVLLDKEIKISMDGKGRATDNVFIERFWWSIKHEFLHLIDYSDGLELHKLIGQYIDYYNNERKHSSLGKVTPASVFKRGNRSAIAA